MPEPVGDRSATRLPALYPHQVDIINAAYGKKAFAIFADCGTGKTRCAIESIKRYKVERSFPVNVIGAFKTLIIAPNTILENWAEEIKRWSSLTYIILHVTRAKRIKLLKEPADIYIINYEALRILELELVAMNFNMIIADELQIGNI